MGGFGSGRPRSRAHVEEGLVLDIGSIARNGGIPGAGYMRHGTFSWSNTCTGEQSATLQYAIVTLPDGIRGLVRLTYTATGSEGEGRQDYFVRVVSSPQPFGGRRWWFICPIKHRHVSKLYMPAGAAVFASRGCWRMSYSSQAESRCDRARRRARKLRARVGSPGGFGDMVQRPKGMHLKTFLRVSEQIERLEGVVDGYGLAILLREYPELGEQFAHLHSET